MTNKFFNGFKEISFSLIIYVVFEDISSIPKSGKLTTKGNTCEFFISSCLLSLAMNTLYSLFSATTSPTISPLKLKSGNTDCTLTRPQGCPFLSIGAWNASVPDTVSLTSTIFSPWANEKSANNKTAIKQIQFLCIMLSILFYNFDFVEITLAREKPK